MNALLELALSLSLLLPALLVYRAGASRQVQANSVTYELRFPRELEPEAVERFLASLTGLLPPWWRRLGAQPVVTLELLAEPGRLHHRLVVPASVRGSVESALQAHLPSVRAEPVEVEPYALRQAAEYRATTNDRPLRVEPLEVTSGLLTAAQPLRIGEQVVVQWLLTPAGPVRPPRLAQRGETNDSPLRDVDLLRAGEAVTARRQKLRAPLLLALGRIGVQAADDQRAHALIRRVEGPLHGLRAPGVHLRRRYLPGSLVAARLRKRAVPLTPWPALLNIEETTAVIGWPLGGQTLPGLVRGGGRLLPVSGAIPRSGTVLGQATFPAQAGRPVALGLDARFRHLAVTGPTGVGKTTLLAQISLQDLTAGHGLVVIDPKGDLVRAVAERLPAHRLGEVILLDPSDDRRAVGYNPLQASGGPELAVEQVLGVMRTIWRANWGPRTDEILRACLYTLVAAGGMTLCEIPPLLTDPAFRRRLLARVTDPLGVEGFWASFEGWSEAEQASAAAPLLNKVRALTMRPRLRGILGQVEPAVDFNRIVGERQVLLVNLAAGTLGSEAAYLLGALLFAGLWDAVAARAALPAEGRPAVMAVIDEFQHVVALPTPAETVLAEARSYRLGLTIAHQHLGQLDADLEHAVLANARSKVVFQTSRADAQVFARELGAGITPGDLMDLPAYEALISPFAAGQVQPPVSVRTEPLGPAVRNAREVQRLSRERWGVAPVEVEAALLARQQGQRAASPRVGRQRRSEP